MENDSGGSSPQSQPGNQQQPDEPGQPAGSSEVLPDDVREQILAERAKIADSGLPRTQLDPEAMRLAVARQTAERELKVAELMKAKANEPLKPFLPIENYKIATPCSSTWEGSDPKERVRYCQKCQLQVYDFTGLQKPEADELIFKRENRKDAPLFKRQDGKFLTSDCPAALKAKRDTVVAVIGGGLIVACIIAVLVMMPKPSPPPPTPTEAAKPPSGTSSAQPARKAARTPAVPAPAAPETPSSGSSAPGGSAYAEYLKSQQGLDQQSGGEVASPPAAVQSSPGPSQTPPEAAPPAPATALPLPPANAPAPAGTTAESQASEPAPAEAPPASDHGVKYYGR